MDLLHRCRNQGGQGGLVPPQFLVSLHRNIIFSIEIMS